jgi:hypothetical protein
MMLQPRKVNIQTAKKAMQIIDSAIRKPHAVRQFDHLAESLHCINWNAVCEATQAD